MIGRRPGTQRRHGPSLRRGGRPPLRRSLRRWGPPRAQALICTAEGQLGSATTTSGPAGTTSFLYDAGGQRLIRRDPGATTLYLGGTEIRLDTATGTRTSTRHYRFNGATVAVRTAAGMQILTADHHGTAGFAVHSSTHALTVRRSLPFGETRGTSPALRGPSTVQTAGQSPSKARREPRSKCATTTPVGGRRATVVRWAARSR